MKSENRLLITGGIFLAIGYLGLALFFGVLTWGSNTGGADIGLDVIGFLSFLSGIIGLALSIVSVSALIGRRRSDR